MRRGRMGGGGVEAVAAGAGADGGGGEPGGFDEDISGLFGDTGVPAAHDAGEAECFLFVGDDKVFGCQGFV